MPTDRSLDILRKAFHSAVATAPDREPSSEPFYRPGVVTGAGIRSVAAAPAHGSWTGAVDFGLRAAQGSVSQTIPRGPVEGHPAPGGPACPPPPGLPGYPELDYVPYAWGTNRFGAKGGALLGHPISYEVVGPTLKSPYCHWQWELGFNALGAGDTLKLVAGPTSADLTGGPLPSFAEAYGVGAMPPGGLYAVVCFTGEGIAGAIASPGEACTELRPSARYELFRVASWAADTVLLYPDKKFNDYFSAPLSGNPAVRGVTFLRPKVTRLAAVPLAGGGATQRNQVFAVLPPERSARTEYAPPYIGGGTCPSWTTGGFDGDGALGAGEASEYGAAQALPTAFPIKSFRAEVDTGPVGAAGAWTLTVTDGTTVTAGHVVRVRAWSGEQVTPASGLFGFFEVRSQVTTTLTLRRVPEPDSLRGTVYHGGGPRAAGPGEVVECEVYPPVSSLFTGRSPDLTLIGATRLTGLIGPREAGGPAGPVMVDTPSERVFSRGGPDRALWDTRSGSTPGSLLDLGFRAVLFPAKSNGVSVEPDFDHPIDTSGPLKLDPAVAEPQFIEVDYDGGVIYLSHPPAPGPECAVAPNGIIVDPAANPRREVILYAALVPYSREPSQRGGGVRVTVADPASVFGPDDHADLYGRRVTARPAGEPFTLNVGDNLAVEEPLDEIPESGFFQFMELDGNGQPIGASPPCYYPARSATELLKVGFWGFTSYPVSGATIILFRKTAPFAFDAGFSSDAARGSSLRVDTLRFRGAQTHFGVDGSVVVSPVPMGFGLDDAYRLGGGGDAGGGGRVINVDGGAVELRPTGFNLSRDYAGASFRVDTASTGTPTVAVGFDHVGALGSGDAFAGYLDRRVFAPATLTTSLDPSFSYEVTDHNEIQITTPGNHFWLSADSRNSIINWGVDLIHLRPNGGESQQLLILADYGADGTRAQVAWRDGLSSPEMNVGVTGTATVYRPVFQSGRSQGLRNRGNWMAGAAAASATEGYFTDGSYGALNLYAGSSTGPYQGSDEGGTTTALAFWARHFDGSTESVKSATRFDTWGRLDSRVTGATLVGRGAVDYVHRGDYVTRAVKDLGVLAGSLAAVGHVVEDYDYATTRLDYLSLFPLVPGASEFEVQFTENTEFNGELELQDAMTFDLIPFGAAILELVSIRVGPDDVPYPGLFWIHGQQTAGMTQYLFIRTLTGAVPAFNAPVYPTINAGQVARFRLRYAATQGRRTASPHVNLYGVGKTATATSLIGVGVEGDAVGTHWAGPSRTAGLGSVDRLAYLVSRADTALEMPGSTSAARETASLDLDGNHQAVDYLYSGGARTVSTQVNLTEGCAVVDDTTPRWYFTSGSGSARWQHSGGAPAVGMSVVFPVRLPSSSAREDHAAALTHRTRLLSVDILGEFHGGVGNEATVRLQRSLVDHATPTSTVSPMELGGATTALLDATGALANNTFLAAAPGGGALYVDTNADQFFFLTITANSLLADVGLDTVRGIRLTWTDPGPRNA